MPKAGTPFQNWVSPSLAKKGRAVNGSPPSGLRGADRSGRKGDLIPHNQKRNNPSVRARLLSACDGRWLVEMFVQLSRTDLVSAALTLARTDPGGFLLPVFMEGKASGSQETVVAGASFTARISM